MARNADLFWRAKIALIGCNHFKKMTSSYIFFYVIAIVMASDQGEPKKSRESRFISMNPMSNGIDISLDFSVPFIKIPLENAFKHNPGPNLGPPKLNFSPTSLTFGGILVVATSLLASVFNNKISPPYQNDHQYSRRSDNDFLTGVILELADSVTSNSHKCPSRLICLAGRNCNQRSLKIWKQIFRNKLVAGMLNATDIEYAMNAGRNGLDCDSFEPCPLDEEQFGKIKNFINFH